MKWFTLKEKQPKDEEIIFIKSKEGISPKYYIVTTKYYLDNHIEFEEAGGEQFSCWDENEIEGWTSLSEIERCEEWN
jgi:hypothetical protein